MRIDLKNITIDYETGLKNEKSALSNINLTIDSAKTYLLIGDTGSGKTTLIYLLNLLIKPTSGEIHIDGKVPFKNQREFRKKMGVSFQLPEKQFFNETVLEEILYAPKNFMIEFSQENIKNILNLVSLREDIFHRSPFKLSGGEQRKVAIASVLSHNPEFLIFDEPSAGLDLKGILSIRQILKNLKSDGKGFLISTHDWNFFKDLCEYTIKLSNGKLEYFGKTIDYFGGDIRNDI